MVKPQIYKQILSTKISIISLNDFLNYIFNQANSSVAVCNVNTVVTADKDFEFRTLINNFDLRIADGMPLVWYLKFNKIRQERMNGSKIFYKAIEAGLQRGTKHYFLGSSDEVLSKMILNLKDKYPELQIGGYFSPPIGTLNEIEEKTLIHLGDIEKCDILWVGLGMPKQEKLISLLRDIKIVKIGVGAVFDWVAGTKKQAPKFIQNIGLEWLFRLLNEPKRLWQRYFYDFIYLIKKFFKFKKS